MHTISFGQWAAIYSISLLVFLAIDAVWLVFVMKPLFSQYIGDLLREVLNVAPAALFYLFYVVGIMFFAVNPALATGDWVGAALRAAFLGLLAYGTYDMTNLATIKGWPTWVALVDTAWGGVISAITAVAGVFAARWVFPTGAAG